MGETSDPSQDEKDAPEPSERWDADDPRRQEDCFAPPKDSCECYCLHCQRTFMSDKMWFQKVVNSKDGFKGFWKCPTPNCGGAGFTFDIFPTDPDHPANAGWVYSDDEYDEEEDEVESEYDPGESKYKQLDEEYGEEDDDIEGEEWKYGLDPGEAPPPQPEVSEEARREMEEEERRYDEPDQRPRELDWSDRDAGSSTIKDDDIPF